MRVTLDIDQLLKDGKITQAEHEKLRELAKESTASLAFNLLVGFGVIAVAGAALALLPVPTTAILIGLLVLVGGLALSHGAPKQWGLLANICILVGALMAGGGIVTETEGSFGSLLLVTLLFAAGAVIARSSLLAVMAVLMLSSCIGARTGYFHASYFLVIKEPSLTIGVFTIISIGLLQLSRHLSADYARISVAASRTGVLLVNFGFWVGSLWGDKFQSQDIIIPDEIFAIAWALALLATAVWAWRCHRRWVLNTTAVFAGIHFYTQWFENLGATPGTVLIAGLLALGFAVVLKRLNNAIKTAG